MDSKQQLEWQNLQLTTSIVQCQQMTTEKVHMHSKMLDSITHAIAAENVFLQECNRINSKLQQENQSLQSELQVIRKEMQDMRQQMKSELGSSYNTMSKLRQDVKNLQDEHVPCQCQTTPLY